MKNILLNPGPTNVSEPVRKALLIPDLCHREPLVIDTYKEVTSKLVNLFGGKDSHDAILFVSSGTGANEAMINGIHGKVLLLNNGKYSQRLGEIMNAYHISFINYVIRDYGVFDLTEIENTIVNDNSITHLMLTHHETTTGVIAPLTEIGQLAKKYNKILVVDAISSIGSHTFDLKDNNIGMCSVSSNKCLESFPGISIVFADKDHLTGLKGKSRNYYFDLYAQWTKGLDGENRFTIPVQLLFALNQALNELIQEGITNRIDRYKENYKLFKEGLQRMGYQIIPQPASMESNYLIRLQIPVDITFPEMRDYLKSKNVTIYAPDEILRENHFLLAAMGCITKQDIDYVLVLFEELLIPKKILN
jgi:2-aminoethylphosphonate-pyruvate transaminase